MSIDLSDVRKMSVWLPVTDEMMIDVGLMEAPPLTPDEKRRIDSFKRRWAIAYAVAAPLDWLGRGAEWLHVEALNALFRILRLNASVSHDEEEDDLW
jgi:hypothetical protein